MAYSGGVARIVSETPAAGGELHVRELTVRGIILGAIFAFPALVILGRTEPLPYWDVTMLSLAGGTMGSLLVVFLRRAYIVEERLPFPEGFACAQVLRAGEEGGSSAKPLAWGGIVAGLLKAAQGIVGVVPASVSGARWAGGAAFAASADISAALLGVGYIVGTGIASLVFMGGAVGWLIAIPVASTTHPEFRTLGAADAAYKVWSEQTRYLGGGAMLVGGVTTLWRLRGPIGRGLAESARMLRTTRVAATSREETDLSAGAVLTAVGLCIPVVFVLCYLMSSNLWLSAALAVALALIGFFATAVAGYLTGIVGASNNPVSGVTIIVLLGIRDHPEVARRANSRG